MRISDWSSDVCSSDLAERVGRVDEAPAQVALHGVGDEDEELLPQRLVEAEAGDRRCPLVLVGLWIDQDVDRVADGVDADEHQHCHYGNDEEALTEAAQKVDRKSVV